MFNFTKVDGLWMVIGPTKELATLVNDQYEESGMDDKVVAVTVTLKSGETKHVVIEIRPAATFIGKFGALEGVPAGYYFTAR